MWRQGVLDIHSRCYLTIAILLHPLGIIYTFSETISLIVISSLISPSACMTEKYLDEEWIELSQNDIARPNWPNFASVCPR